MKSSNREELNGIAKAIKLIIDNELTDTERLYLTEYIINQKKLREISAEYGTHKSVISRTIKRGKNRIMKYLKYSVVVDKYVQTHKENSCQA